jgi:phenylalanyl-tRNA synthetase alpha subunit
MGKLRFKPAYNPYTEPSMEIFSYHEGNQIVFIYYDDFILFYLRFEKMD